MTRLSENRVSHLARLILDGIKKSGLGTFKNEGRALSETKQALAHFFERDDHLDTLVRQKIQSLSRHVPPAAASGTCFTASIWKKSCEKSASSRI